MEKYSVNVYSECPFDKVSQRRITMCYVIPGDNIPLQYHTLCHSYHDGYPACQKCIAFFSSYIHKHGLPEERQVITPKL